MLDVFFLSYNEVYADDNFAELLKIVPHARRVHGVKGFYAAHKVCAERSMTHNFYVVDADAQIVPEFDFSFTPSKHKLLWGRPECEALFLWNSMNPINGLTYGYGGVKLIPKLPLIQNQNKDIVDFTTGFGLNIQVIDKVSNITAFNVDEFSTWRSAFRECAKLSANATNHSLYRLPEEELKKIQDEAEYRLHVWQTQGRDKKYGKYAIHGAKMGSEYGIKYSDVKERLKLINDYDWMKNEFNRFF